MGKNGVWFVLAAAVVVYMVVKKSGGYNPNGVQIPPEWVQYKTPLAANSTSTYRSSDGFFYAVTTDSKGNPVSSTRTLSA